MSGDWVAAVIVGTERSDLGVKVLGFLFWDKALAERVLTGCTNIHGKKVVDSLRAESFRIEFGKRGGNALKPLCGFHHGGLFTKDNGTGLDVTLDSKVSSKTTECGFDLVVQFLRNGVWTRCSPHLDLGSLQLKVD